MSNLTFLRKFTFRFALGLAVLGTPRLLLAEAEEGDEPTAAVNAQGEQGGGGRGHSRGHTGAGGPNTTMASIKSAVNEFLGGLDVQGCSSAANSLSGMINGGTLPTTQQ